MSRDVFGVSLVRVPRQRRREDHLLRPVDTKRIDRIGVPFIPFCE